MSNARPSDAKYPPISPAQPFEWWQEQWAQNANPLARMQLAWMESLTQAMQFEAEFLAAMAENSLKLASCFQGEEAPNTPAEMHRCYQKLLKHASDAHMERMEKATTLSHDFRKRIWEEI
ncbi:hypothetical protein KG088_18440 [Halomonas sp. TRM85114]|uniref:hypothetical protein n=1 Tax=Halomonas jincaotanensis TaxID=2810616 RepID=UPI001BD50C9F|nr:hypothetical protein [Halomonas jincaotanensis]MBS9405578.1 hypothetical protein [Halomonas jincaotanensis]